MKRRSLFAVIAALLVCATLGLLLWHERAQPRVLADVVWEAPHSTPTSRPIRWLRLAEYWSGLHRPANSFCPALSGPGLANLTAARVQDVDGKGALKIGWQGSGKMNGSIAMVFGWKRLSPGKCYAMIGAVRREQAGSGCLLNLTTISFVPSTTKKNELEGRAVARTDLAVGEAATWQPFALVADASKIDFSRSDFLLNYQMDGPATIYLRDVKFVEFPRGTNPLGLLAWSITPTTTVDWAAVGIVFVPSAVAVVALLLLRGKDRREIELRRIASLDS